VLSIGPPLPPAPLLPPAGIARLSSGEFPQAESVNGPNASSDFAQLMLGKFDEVNAMQTDADDMVHQMLTGGNVNQAEVLTAVQKADLAFRMMLQVRNKLIEAYRELQQIQI
jgi:flagellar hook-basal body complex protein FliE